jgi:hypothetical protein
MRFENSAMSKKRDQFDPTGVRRRKCITKSVLLQVVFVNQINLLIFALPPEATSAPEAQ